ncbi:MAG: acyloxyacyl hydrolase [Verrucomicrobiota bacterium]
MRILSRAAALLFFALSASLARAGSDRITTHFTPEAPSFEISTETAYLLGFIGNPNSYEIGSQFVTARWRFGPVYTDGWLRGYNQFYVLAMAEPIFRGPENFYYGISVGLRYNFLHENSRFIPFVSGGVGLGWIDSHSQIFGAQGQDFTFNILTAVGVSYKMSEHWKATASILYQHLSNAAQTDPNPSLNLIGPQLGLTYSF